MMTGEMNIKRFKLH